MPEEFECRGVTYELVMASDVGHAGMSLECYRKEAADRSPLIEAFWSDASEDSVFYPPREPLRFKLVEHFVRVARRRLPPARRVDG